MFFVLLIILQYTNIHTQNVLRKTSTFYVNIHHLLTSPPCVSFIERCILSNLLQVLYFHFKPAAGSSGRHVVSLSTLRCVAAGAPSRRRTAPALTSRVRDARRQPEITVKELFDISALGVGPRAAWVGIELSVCRGGGGRDGGRSWCIGQIRIKKLHFNSLSSESVPGSTPFGYEHFIRTSWK